MWRFVGRFAHAANVETLRRCCRRCDCLGEPGWIAARRTDLPVCASLAWLLADDYEGRLRLRLRSQASKLYNLRSDIVHGNENIRTSELFEASRAAIDNTLRAVRVLLSERPELLSECRGGDERSMRLMLGG